MLFCKGNVRFVMLMMRAMKALSLATGLYANNDKSVVYFENVQEEV